MALVTVCLSGALQRKVPCSISLTGMHVFSVCTSPENKLTTERMICSHSQVELQNTTSIRIRNPRCPCRSLVFASGPHHPRPVPKPGFGCRIRTEPVSEPNPNPGKPIPTESGHGDAQTGPNPVPGCRNRTESGFWARETNRIRTGIWNRIRIRIRTPPNASRLAACRYLRYS